MKKPPNVQLKNLGEAPGSKPFLKIKRVKLVAEYADGSVSNEFVHDIVLRKNMDAAIIIAYYIDNDMPMIYLRSSIRPAIADRFVDDTSLWELPAGMIETGENPVDTAVRELKEELGFEATADQFTALGPPVFSSVGLSAEQLFFFKVQVNPNKQNKPTEDGSALEKNAEIITVCLQEMLCACHRGVIKDAHTELGIRRFLV